VLNLVDPEKVVLDVFQELSQKIANINAWIYFVFGRSAHEESGNISFY